MTRLPDMPLGGDACWGGPARSLNAWSPPEQPVSLRAAAEEASALYADRSRRLPEAVANSLPEGIMALKAVRDAEGRLVDFVWLLANPAAERLSGYVAGDLVGRRLLEVAPAVAESGLFQALLEVAETGRPLSLEHDEAATTERRVYHVTATRLGDGITVTFRNVTERIRSEQREERYRADLELRNRELQEFAYVASHDLREPLRKVQAFAQLLVEEHAGRFDETGRHYLGRVQDAAGRMTALINALLDFSRATVKQDRFEGVDLSEIVAGVLLDLETSIADQGATIEIGEMDTIEADPMQMRQLLQNLVGNAIKFSMPDRAPVVKISATRVEDRERGEKGARCLLRIADNGVGFEERYLDRIFTPFQRLHGRETYRGSGMGLAICRRIAERHGGSVTATSTPGEGSVFLVDLPVQQESAMENDERA